MAKFELKFKDLWFNSKAEINVQNDEGKDYIEIVFFDENNIIDGSFNMDKSTAIKFAKALRTEINKITESENLIDGGSSFKTLEKGNYSILTKEVNKGGDTNG